MQQILTEYQELKKQQERSQTRSHHRGVYRLAVGETDIKLIIVQVIN